MLLQVCLSCSDKRARRSSMTSGTSWLLFSFLFSSSSPLLLFSSSPLLLSSSPPLLLSSSPPLLLSSHIIHCFTCLASFSFLYSFNLSIKQNRVTKSCSLVFRYAFSLSLDVFPCIRPPDAANALSWSGVSRSVYCCSFIDSRCSGFGIHILNFFFFSFFLFCIIINRTAPAKRGA